MDHQIQHDIDGAVAGNKAGEATKGQRKRLLATVLQVALQRGVDGVIALDVADLQQATGVGGQRGQLLGLRQVLGKGFFDQHVLACLQALLDVLVV